MAELDPHEPIPAAPHDITAAAERGEVDRRFAAFGAACSPSPAGLHDPIGPPGEEGLVAAWGDGSGAEAKSP